MVRQRRECALCRNNAELRNSHIAPEFLYAPLYDEIHRVQVIQSKPLRIPTIQKGLKSTCYARHASVACRSLRTTQPAFGAIGFSRNAFPSYDRSPAGCTTSR